MQTAALVLGIVWGGGVVVFGSLNNMKPEWGVKRAKRKGFKSMTGKTGRFNLAIAASLIPSFAEMTPKGKQVETWVFHGFFRMWRVRAPGSHFG